jgi:hypothetical protein
MIKENRLNQNKDTKEALLNHRQLPIIIHPQKQPKPKDARKDI